MKPSEGINFEKFMAAPDTNIFAPEELVSLKGVVDEEKECILAAEKGRLAENDIEELKIAVELLSIAETAEERKMCEADIERISKKIQSLMIQRPAVKGLDVVTFADLVATSKVYQKLMGRKHGLESKPWASVSNLSQQERATLEKYDTAAKQELVVMLKEANADQLTFLHHLDGLNFKIPEPHELSATDRAAFTEGFRAAYNHERLTHANVEDFVIRLSNRLRQAFGSSPQAVLPEFDRDAYLENEENKRLMELFWAYEISLPHPEYLGSGRTSRNMEALQSEFNVNEEPRYSPLVINFDYDAKRLSKSEGTRKFLINNLPEKFRMHNLEFKPKNNIDLGKSIEEANAFRELLTNLDPLEAYKILTTSSSRDLEVMLRELYPTAVEQKIQTPASEIQEGRRDRSLSSLFLKLEGGEKTVYEKVRNGH